MSLLGFYAGFYITVIPRGRSQRAAAGAEYVNCWESDFKDPRVTEEMDNLILLKLLTLLYAF